MNDVHDLDAKAVVTIVLGSMKVVAANPTAMPAERNAFMLSIQNTVKNGGSSTKRRSKNSRWKFIMPMAVQSASVAARQKWNFSASTTSMGIKYPMPSEGLMLGITPATIFIAN